MWSDLTVGPCFKVKRGMPHLLLVLEVCIVKPTYCKSWPGNLLTWLNLTFGPHFKGQTRTDKLKSAYNSIIIGSRVWQCQSNVLVIMG